MARARKGARVEVPIAAVERVAAPIRRANRRIESMTAPIRRVRASFRALAREAHLGSIARGLGSLTRGLRNLALGGVAGLTAAFLAVRKLATSGDDLGRLSRRLGITVEKFQEMEYAGVRQGVTVEVWRKAIAALSKRVGELKANTGAMSTLFGKVDPGFKKQLAGARDTGEALDMLLAYIHKLDDPLKRAAVAGAAFSRAGLSMVQLAELDAAGIQALREEARSLGFVMTRKMTDASEAMVDSLTNVQKALLGLGQAVTFELFPDIKALIDGLKEWILANQSWLKSDITAAIKASAGAVKGLYSWVRETAPKVQKVVDALGGWKTVLTAIGIVLATVVLTSLVAIITSLGSVTAGFAALGVAVAALAYKFGQHFDGIIETLRELKDWTAGLFGAGSPLVVGTMGALTGGEAGPMALAGGLGMGRAAKAELDGRIRIELDDRRSGRGVEIAAQGFGFDVDVDTGPMLPGD